MTGDKASVESSVAAGSRHRSLEDVRLFVTAFRLAGQAQAIAHRPLPDVVAALVRHRGLPRFVVPDAAWVAACRACRYRARWRGGLDTCLVRCLVAGTLLSGRPGVALHVGFRPDPTGFSCADGHAWLRVGEQVLGAVEPPSGEAFQSVFELPMQRWGCTT